MTECKYDSRRIIIRRYNPLSYVPDFLKDLKTVLDKHEANKWDIEWDGGELASIWEQVNDIYWEHKPDD